MPSFLCLQPKADRRHVIPAPSSCYRLNNRLPARYLFILAIQWHVVSLRDLFDDLEVF